MVVELTVLGCSGSYGSPSGGACSGYLVRAGGATIWMDCGNGSFANLQYHANPADLTAVVITHAHPDHSVDIYGLHVLYKYGLGCNGLPVYAPEGVERTLEGLVGEWTDTFDWRLVGDGDKASVGDVDLRFLRTDHPLPTVAHRRRNLCLRPRCTRWSISPSFSRWRRSYSVAATSSNDEQRSDENCRPGIGGGDRYDVCCAPRELDRHDATAARSECD